MTPQCSIPGVTPRPPLASCTKSNRTRLHRLPRCNIWHVLLSEISTSLGPTGTISAHRRPWRIPSKHHSVCKKQVSTRSTGPLVDARHSPPRWKSCISSGTVGKAPGFVQLFKRGGQAQSSPCLDPSRNKIMKSRATQEPRS